MVDFKLQLEEIKLLIEKEDNIKIIMETLILFKNRYKSNIGMFDQYYIEQFIFFNLLKKFDGHFSINLFSENIVAIFSFINDNIYRRKYKDTYFSNNLHGSSLFYIHEDFADFLFTKIKKNNFLEFKINDDHINIKIINNNQLINTNYSLFINKYDMYFDKYNSCNFNNSKLNLVEKALIFITDKDARSKILLLIQEKSRPKFFRVVGKLVNYLNIKEEEKYLIFDLISNYPLNNKSIYSNYVWGVYNPWEYKFLNLFINNNGESYFIKKYEDKFYDYINIKLPNARIKKYISFLGEDFINCLDLNKVNLGDRTHFLSKLIELYPALIFKLTKEELLKIPSKSYKRALMYFPIRYSSEMRCMFVKKIIEIIDSKRRLNYIFKHNPKLFLHLY